MKRLPKLSQVIDIHTGASPEQEAWVYHFLLENNLEYMFSPSLVASPEQLRFMVALQDNQIYIPCDDALFIDIYTHNTQRINKEYSAAWLFVVNLLRSYALSREDAHRILSYCRYRFQVYRHTKAVLPSRMIKRLVGIVLTQCGETDPFQTKKIKANAEAAKLFTAPEVVSALNRLPSFDSCIGGIADARKIMGFLEIKRLMHLSTHLGLHHACVKPQELADELSVTDDSLGLFVELLGNSDTGKRKIMLIADRAGGIIFDIALAKKLIQLGHHVILVLKDAFYFSGQVLSDVNVDPVLREHLADAYFLENASISKNSLLRTLRENHLIVISDGTSEQLNLYRTSVTFARAWRECDLIMVKGKRNKNVLLGTSHLFTRDIISYSRTKEGKVEILFKPRAEWVTKIAEQDLNAKANEIIVAMRNARAKGQRVMFYSAIIGSIPGQTKVAIEVVDVFVEYLRKNLENTFIINPSEHFEEGLDGDDLMFMWEQVQRCGLLDVWRFQTVEDIEKSFALMGKKIPAVWLGKDSTFSTGCTKEMNIALSVQSTHSELQIIGPPSDRFFRRRDYGIGKYYDATLKG